MSKKQKKRAPVPAPARNEGGRDGRRAAPGKTQGSGNSRRRLLGAYLLLALLSLGAYANSFSADWHFDDKPGIISNPNIQITSLDSTSLLRAMVQDRRQNRPFSNLTFALNYYFNQTRVEGYHLVNLLWHLLAGGLIFHLLRVTFRLAGRPEPRRDLAAFLAAGLWAVHPLQPQAVTYIVQRQTVMASALMLATLAAYLAGRESREPGRRRAFYLAAALLWVLALGSKEIAVITPALIFGYELFFFQKLSWAFLRRQRRFLLPALVLLGLGAALLLRPAMWEQLTAELHKQHFTLGQRLLTEPRVLVQYLGLTLWPLASRLSIEHDPSLSFSLFSPWTTLPAILLWLLLLAGAVRYGRRFPLLSFALFWYLGNLFLESSFLPLDLMFEHRLYLSSLAVLALLAAAPVLYLPQSRPALASLGLILALFLLGALSRNQIWRTDYNLWRDCTRKTPFKARPYVNLGVIDLQAGRTERALAKYNRAIRLEPDFAEAYYDRGVLYYQQGQMEPALADYSKALELKPDYTLALNNRATIYKTQGRTGPALADFNLAIKLNPAYAKAYLNRANTYEAIGEDDRAIADYSQGIALNSSYPEAYFNRGRLYLIKGQLDLALADFNQALNRDPRHANARLSRGDIFLKQGQYDQALADYSLALELDPNSADAYLRRGNALLAKGENARAAADFARARELNPGSVNQP